MEKKKIVISSITVAVLLVLVVASSYAYFQARIASSGQTSTSVGAKTLDSFVINKGNDISLIANQDNFALGKGDLSSSTTASVTFTSRNDEASSYAYYAGFYIALNEFFYSSTTDTEQFDTYGNSYGTTIISHSNYPSYNLLPDFDDERWINNLVRPSELFIRTTYENQNAIKFDGEIEFYSENMLKNLNKDNNNYRYIDCYAGYVTDTSADFVPTLRYNSVRDGYREVAFYKEFDSNSPINGTMAGETVYGSYEVIEGLSVVHWWYKIPQPFFTSTDITYVGIGFSRLYGNQTVLLYSPICVDKNTTEGANFDINDYYKYVDPVPELELTIKKNGEVVGTYDITNASSGDYIKFKEYDEDEVNEVYNNAMNQCMLTGLVRIDPVKYATIEACGDDLDCGLNAYQEIVGACNGDEDCENLIYADVDQLSPACNEKANIEANKVGGYGISANAGATTTDTWEAIVTFKNLDVNQNPNIGKSFEGYFQIYSYKDFSSDEIIQSNLEKCMQEWFPSFDYETDYDTFVSEACNGDEECQNQIDDRTGTCHNLWG